MILEPLTTTRVGLLAGVGRQIIAGRRDRVRAGADRHGLAGLDADVTAGLLAGAGGQRGLIYNPRT